MNNKTAEGEFLLDDSSNYDDTVYASANNTVDICINRFNADTNQVEVLLIKRKHNPFKDCWAIPGGFIDLKDNEAMDVAALRELSEETGVSNVPIRKLTFEGNIERDPRKYTITGVYYSVLDQSMLSTQQIEAKDDAIDWGWFPLNDLPNKLAFDHAKILDILVRRFKIKIKYSDIAFEFIGKEFTLSGLRKVYESILGRDLLATNFGKYINTKFNITATGGLAMASRGRPSRIYTLDGIKEEI